MPSKILKLKARTVVALSKPPGIRKAIAATGYIECCRLYTFVR